MNRTALAISALLLGACGQPPETSLAAAPWELYRQTFITGDGRVVDTGLGGISHSEGQAYAMILAEASGDHETFERVWGWTRRHLQVRPDALLAWRWDPAAAAVTDLNNASDGDLIAAWALLRAARRWGVTGYRRQAWRLLNDIESRLVVATPAGPAILPGAEGFVHDGVVTGNPSYWIFPALSDLARLQPAGPWASLHRSGRALLENARFGPWELPPDWVSLTDPPALAPRFPARFGYEAVRVPLYACWDGLSPMTGLSGLAAFWASSPEPPAWIGLESVARAPFPLSAGGLSVRRLLLRNCADPGRSDGPIDSDRDYYDVTLQLLAQVAAHEVGR